MTHWQRFDALAGVAVDRVFGEMIQITPRHAASEYVKALPDPSRAVVEVRAVFSEETAEIDLRGQRVTGENRGTTRIVNSQSAVQIMAAEVVRIGYEVADYDLVTLIQRRGKPTYSVSLADVLDAGDLVLYLSPEKAP